MEQWTTGIKIKSKKYKIKKSIKQVKSKKSCKLIGQE